MKITENRLNIYLKQTKNLDIYFSKLFNYKNNREQKTLLIQIIKNLLEIEKNILELRTLTSAGLQENSNDK